MVGAVHAGLLLQEILLDAGEERIRGAEESTAVGICELAPAAHAGGVDGLRQHLGELRGHVPGEGRQHRFHVQCALAAEDLFLQFRLSVDPMLRQRPLPAVDVVHAVPREMRGAGEEGTDLPVAEAIVAPDFLPDRLLPGDCQGHIHPVQGHPVDEMLPLPPFPPGHSVAEGAVVQKEACGEACLRFHRLGHCRQGVRKIQGIEVVPADIGKAEFLEIAVQPDCHGVGVVAFDEDSVALLGDFVGIRGVSRLLEDDAGGHVPHHPAGKRFCVAFIRSLAGAGAGQQACQQQDGVSHFNLL